MNAACAFVPDCRQRELCQQSPEPPALRPGVLLTIARQTAEDTDTDTTKLTRELFGLFLLFAGLLLLLSLGTYDPRDPSLNHVVSSAASVRNKAGLFGAYCSGFFADLLGIVAYLIPALFLLTGARRVLGAAEWPWWRWCAFFFLGCSLTVAGQAWRMGIAGIRGGGLLGNALYGFSNGYFGNVGTALVWGFLFLLAVQVLLGFSWLALARRCIRDLFAVLARSIAAKRKPEQSGPPLILAEDNKAASGPDKALAVQMTSSASERKASDTAAPVVFRPPAATAGADGDAVPASDILPGVPGKALPGTDLGFLDSPADITDPPWVHDLETDNIAERAVRDRRGSVPSPARASVAQPQPVAAESAGSRVVISEAVKTTPATPMATQPKDRRIPLPALDLLHTVASAAQKTPREELEAKGRTLMTCLSDFGIQGELVGISPGPVITMFEVRPAAGVRVARIENLSYDLALALKAESVRIQAPIPGTNTVGVEIPNDIREIVCLKELFGSAAFARSESLLTMALGKDIQGAPVMADLARMPHLLVAGATGSGKSVCLNTILLSLLYKARPEEVQLLLVDPKQVELAVYADLPHLAHPVITDMELAKNALKWASSEMDRRLGCFTRVGARNITGYNEKVAALDKEKLPHLADLEVIPYLVVIIDEFGDLMMTAAKEVEGYIIRLAAVARAAGIHLILATQRPSADVITGLIKSNLPSRIAFYVSSSSNSRIILDETGAECLLGKGDMLYKPTGGRLQRLHGGFVRDDDVATVVGYWRERQKPSYQVDFSDWGADAGNGFSGGGGDDVASDPMYAEAVTFVREQGKASISLLQRRFRIGFNRAARFIEQMEQDGIIGPQDGSKPRAVR